MELTEIDRDSMDWISVIRDRDQWRALVTTEINVRFS
jgi:hypothetical protein